MSNVRIKNCFGVKVAPGSVEFEEAVSSHCRGEREKAEKGKQVKQEQKLSDAHRHISITTFILQNVTNTPSLDCMTTLKVHSVDLTCESPAIFFELSILVKAGTLHTTITHIFMRYQAKT